MYLGATDRGIIIIAGHSEVPLKFGLCGTDIGRILQICDTRIPLAVQVSVCVCKAPHYKVDLKPRTTKVDMYLNDTHPE